jgi:hypothetical protein
MTISGTTLDVYKKRLVPARPGNKPFEYKVVFLIYPTSTEDLFSDATKVSSLAAANL